MAAFSLAQAAEAAGVNRSTILRAIKSGRITGSKDELGAWHVEPAELHRSFPPAEAQPSAVPDHAQGNAELRLRAALAEERLGELKAMLEDMRGERDQWREVASRLALGAPKPEPEPEPKPKPMTWWRWLRSTGS